MKRIHCFFSYFAECFIQENEEMLTYASNVTSISLLPSAWCIILIIIETIRERVECIEMDFFIFFFHLAMWSMNAWCPSVSFFWQFLLTQWIKAVSSQKDVRGQQIIQCSVVPVFSLITSEAVPRSCLCVMDACNRSLMQIAVTIFCMT